jgi:hypothetical protein
MERPASQFERDEESASSRSNRILALSVVGILFLTLYPFRFSLHPNSSLNGSPFLLVSGVKIGGPFDAFLNISLFVPFGFGLSQKHREQGKSGGGNSAAHHGSRCILVLLHRVHADLHPHARFRMGRCVYKCSEGSGWLFRIRTGRQVNSEFCV